MSSSNGHPKPPEKRQKRPREKQADHLAEHRFKPGNDGNVENGGGRPKGSIDIWARIRNELKAKVAQGQYAGEEYANLVAKSFVKQLLKGKWPQTKELIDREEGKVPERLADANGNNIIIKVEYVRGRNHADD